MDLDFSVTATVEADGCVVVRPVGELDMASAPGFATALEHAFRTPGVTGIVIDLRGLDFIDACGITALVRARSRATGMAGQLRVRDPHGEVDMVLRLTGVADQLHLPPVPADTTVARDAAHG